MTVLADRVAVVTGAWPGIGAGLAAMLADQGAPVVLAARRGEKLERVAAGIGRAGGVAAPAVTDLADDDSMARLLTWATAEPGPVDVLVNNAGAGLWKPPEQTSIAEWDHTFTVNVRAAAYLCAAWARRVTDAREPRAWLWSVAGGLCPGAVHGRASAGSSGCGRVRP